MEWEDLSMREFWNIIQVVFTALSRWISDSFEGCDGLIYTLLAFMALDYIMDIIRSLTDKKLSMGLKGICRTVLTIALINVACLLDIYVIGTDGVFRAAIIYFYIANEGRSLIENAEYLGLPIPPKLHKVLEQLYDRTEKEIEEESKG